MLQVARLGPKPLGDAAEAVAGYLRGQLADDGGFRDRAGVSDLYYTVFGLEGLLALRADMPFSRVTRYLQTFAGGDGLDFVHLACLARCWAAIPDVDTALESAHRHSILRRIESFRSRDGGYHNSPEAEHGTVYGCFLALGAYQDLREPLPAAGRMLGCLGALQAEDGGFANQRDIPMGLTPSTAAAVALYRQLGEPPSPDLARWLLDRCLPGGGFIATPLAPIPDLLSTATALHALSGLQADLDPIREPCLDFIDTLWTNRGAFHGTWADDTPDCEYTYYALLALGHLSL